MIIHELPVPQFGATHVLENRFCINRVTRTVIVEVRPGTVVPGGDGEPDEVFVPHPVIGWVEKTIGPEHWDGWLAYCETWDAGDRPRATLALSCALEYMTMLDMGLV
jgi:hypothetical protein